MRAASLLACWVEWPGALPHTGRVACGWRANGSRAAASRVGDARRVRRMPASNASVACVGETGGPPWLPLCGGEGSKGGVGPDVHDGRPLIDDAGSSSEASVREARPAGLAGIDSGTDRRVEHERAAGRTAVFARRGRRGPASVNPSLNGERGAQMLRVPGQGGQGTRWMQPRGRFQKPREPVRGSHRCGLLSSTRAKRPAASGQPMPTTTTGRKGDAGGGKEAVERVYRVSMYP